MFISALVLKSLRIKTKFWLMVVVVFGILSLGSYLPGFHVFANIPILNLLRVPSRALLVVGIGMAMVSANGLHDLIQFQASRTSSHLRLMVPAIIVFVISMTITFYIISVDNKPGILWGGIVFTLSGLLIFYISLINKTKPFLFIVIIGLLVADLSVTSFSMMRFEKKEIVLAQQKVTVDFIQSKTPLFGRIYSPSYSVPQEIVPEAGLQQADGINPLQLMSYVSFMERATGVTSNGYSVTLPAFATASPDVDNIDATPDSSRLGLLNVAYIVSAYPITAKAIIAGKYNR